MYVYVCVCACVLLWRGKIVYSLVMGIHNRSRVLDKCSRFLHKPVSDKSHVTVYPTLVVKVTNVWCISRLDDMYLCSPLS